VQVRFVEGAPLLQTLVNGVPTSIGSAYLAVGSRTVASQFPFGSVTPFAPFAAGALSLEARDSLGYSVGPLKTPALASGKRYTIVVTGAYPHYSALAFTEPDPSTGATLAIYAASPSVPSVDFGSFATRGQARYHRFGSVKYGALATAALGKQVMQFGAYVGNGTHPLSNGTITIAAVNPFDARGALPFHAASRFSLFFVDASGGGAGPLFGSLDP
jgi:hypothetical protein